jgi:hypothetical protein
VNPADLKKFLVASGFQVFRTVGTQILLAERVRDNLVMDSGVAVVCGRGLSVRVTLKAQASDFPREGDDQLLSRARGLIAGGGAAIEGFQEVETAVVPIADPGSADRQIDTSCEVTFEKVGVELDALKEQLMALLALRRTARHH